MAIPRPKPGPTHLLRGILLLSIFLAAPAARAERKLTLKEAVDLAMKQNLELQVLQETVAEADATRKSVRGHFGPKLMVEGNVMVWDSALEFDLGFGGAGLDPKVLKDPVKAAEFIKQYKLTTDELVALSKKENQDMLSAMFKVMGLDGTGMSVRDQVTASFSATLAQPLTPLISLYKGYAATRHMKQAAHYTLGAKRAEVAFKVADTYLKLMQAQRFEKIAQTGVAQVIAHLKMAEKYREAGLIGKQEVLKAQVELARAREQVIQARYGASLTQAALKLYTGLPQSEQVVPVDQLKDPPPPLSATLQTYVHKALEHRDDLKSLVHMGKAAEAGKERIKWDFLPQISAIATYQYTHGQGTFMPEHAFFGGGVLQWELWDWGAKYYSMKSAGAKARQVGLGRRLLKEAISLEVQKAVLDLHRAKESMSVARVAIVEAAEGVRIEQKRFETQSNTSTDVLDAQLALTRAELIYTTSLSAYYIARAGLAKAMGTIHR